MSEDLTNKIVAWANEIASYAAQLPSRQAREEYLAERRRELVAGAQAEGAAPRDAAILADACVNAARRIMTELLAQRVGMPAARTRVALVDINAKTWRLPTTKIAAAACFPSQPSNHNTSQWLPLR